MINKSLNLLILFSLLCACEQPSALSQNTDFCALYTFKAQNQDMRSELSTTAIDRLAEYRVQLNVGTPAQAIMVAPDTGSSNLLIAQNDCTGCTSTTRYAPSRSSTSIKVNQPAFSLPYVSGSLQVFEYKDTLSLNCGPKIMQALFGAISQDSSSLPSILGLAGSNIAGPTGNSIKPFLVELTEQNPNIQNIFSITFCGSSGNSALLIGGGDPRINGSTFKYTSNVTPNATYTISPQQLKMPDGSTLSFNNQKAIIDSGSTLTFLPASIATAIQQAVQKAISITLPSDFWETNVPSEAIVHANLSATDIANLPTFYLELPGLNPQSAPIQVQWTPKAYFKVWSDGSYSFGIRSMGANQQMSFGQSFIEDKTIIFNNVNNSIGFSSNSVACTQELPMSGG